MGATLPRSVDVFGKPYRIDIDKTEDNPDCGLCSSEHCSIRIADRICAMQKRDTLMHELTHAISDEMRLHLKEGQVHRVAMGWLSILRHNPDLVAFLTADDA